jgi:hypothetical protein
VKWLTSKGSSFNSQLSKKSLVANVSVGALQAESYSKRRKEIRCGACL